MEPEARDYPPEAPPRPSGNGMGVAGFVLSLVGIVVLCGLLCPLGLIFSLIGLGRQPKGLAIAGTVLGVLGSLWLVVAIKFGWPLVDTVVQLRMADQAIEAHATANGEYPDDAAGEGVVAEYRDHWHRPFRYKRTGSSFDLRSAGPDGAFDTEDDIHSGLLGRRP